MPIVYEEWRRLMAGAWVGEEGCREGRARRGLARAPIGVRSLGERLRAREDRAILATAGLLAWP